MIYLAGPITGCTYDEATNWRETFPGMVGDKVKCLSPMRGKAFLSGLAKPLGEHDTVLTQQRGIWCRDHFDVHRCKALVVNLLDSKIVSIGTMFELAWASERKVPVILVMEDSGNIHEHPFVRESAHFRVNNLDDAAELVREIIG